MARDPFDDPAALIERVYAYVAYRVGDGVDAEDIASAAIERAFRYREGYRVDRGAGVAWVIGIARRQISDHFAARPKIADAELEDQASPEAIDADAATRLDLRTAVLALDERDRELVALRYGADLTARQIGELVDMRTNAVEVALHRALRELRATAPRAARRATVGGST